MKIFSVYVARLFELQSLLCHFLVEGPQILSLSSPTSVSLAIKCRDYYLTEFYNGELVTISKVWCIIEVLLKLYIIVKLSAGSMIQEHG